MAFSDGGFHEEFSTERIVKEIRLASPGMLVGEYPAAFARELILKWEFSSRRYAFDPLRWVVMLQRDELPEALRGGFGVHIGAVLTSRSAAPTMLNRMDHVNNFYADRLLEARLCKGEFASGRRKAF